jgi:hypothetical protein
MTRRARVLTTLRLAALVAGGWAASALKKRRGGF